MTLRKILVQFSELVFVALESQICAALAKAQPAQPPLRMSSDFPNDRGAVEDMQGSFMMERRLQMKFEWTELPAVLAEGLLRLYGAGVELAESVFSSKDAISLMFGSTPPVDGAASAMAMVIARAVVRRRIYTSVARSTIHRRRRSHEPISEVAREVNYVFLLCAALSCTSVGA